MAIGQTSEMRITEPFTVGSYNSVCW